MKFKLNVFEERILRVLTHYYNPMTINDIADQSGIHWKTAEKHLQTLKSKKLVNKLKLDADGREYWQASEK